MAKISYLVYQFFNIIFLLMLVRVLLSWFPNVNWFREPAYSFKKFTDYIFEPFRKIIPPVGMLDLSPIIAFFAVGLIQKFLVTLLISLGL